ncbi:MAG: hypothetical protein M3O22_04920 [Pseudomonadota bacterium]|nr:hypothetical protein [Pseudomonadota bacterium]
MRTVPGFSFPLSTIIPAVILKERQRLKDLSAAGRSFASLTMTKKGTGNPDHHKMTTNDKECLRTRGVNHCTRAARVQLKAGKTPKTRRAQDSGGGIMVQLRAITVQSVQSGVRHASGH